MWFGYRPSILHSKHSVGTSRKKEAWFPDSFISLQSAQRSVTSKFRPILTSSNHVVNLLLACKKDKEEVGACTGNNEGNSPATLAF